MQTFRAKLKSRTVSEETSRLLAGMLEGVVEKGYPADKLQEVIAQAQKERSEGTQVLVVRMNKNKKFQKEKLTAEGYEEFVEFFNR